MFLHDDLLACEIYTVRTQTLTMKASQIKMIKNKGVGVQMN